MNAPLDLHRFTLEPFDARSFANLCGQFDEHLHQIEKRLDIEIRNRGNQFELVGDASRTQAAENLLQRLYREAQAASRGATLGDLLKEKLGDKLNTLAGGGDDTKPGDGDK